MMETDGIPLDSKALVELLKSPLFDLTMGLYKANLPIVNVDCLNAALSACLAEAKEKLARQLLSDSPVCPNVESFNLTIKACIHAGSESGALEVLEDMKNFSAVAVSEDMKNLRTIRLRPNGETFGILMSGFIVRGNDAKLAFGRALELCGDEAAIVTRRELDESLRVVLNDNHWVLAPQLIARMRDAKIDLDVSTWRVLMQAAVRSGEEERINGLILQAEANGLGKEAFEEAVRFAANKGLPKLAFKLLSNNASFASAGAIECVMLSCREVGLRGLVHQSMRIALQKPTVRRDLSPRLFTIAISGAGAKVPRALGYLEKMKRHGIRPNSITYSAVIGVCKRAKRWEDAKRLIGEMRECAVPASASAYSNAIHACGRAGRWKEALALLGSMDSDGILPNVVCFTATIGACFQGMEIREALSLLDQMRARRVEPNVVTYGLIVRRLTYLGEHKASIAVYEEMLSRLHFLPESAIRDIEMAAAHSYEAHDKVLPVS